MNPRTDANNGKSCKYMLLQFITSWRKIQFLELSDELLCNYQELITVKINTLENSRRKNTQKIMELKENK